MTVTHVLPRASGTIAKALIVGSVLAGLLATGSPASAQSAEMIAAWRACLARLPPGLCLAAAGAYAKGLNQAQITRYQMQMQQRQMDLEQQRLDLERQQLELQRQQMGR